MESKKKLREYSISVPNGEELTFTYFGGSSSKVAANLQINELFGTEVYTKPWCGEKLDNFKSVIDVGAHVGLFVIYLKLENPDIIVYNFEPEQENVDLLIKNTLDFGFKDNMFTSLKGLSDETAVKKFYRYNHIESSLKPRKNASEISIDVVRLEEFKDFDIEYPVDLMKVDVEGHELNVLKGAESLLRERKIKNLALATYHTQSEAKKVQEYLLSLGYNSWTYKYPNLKYGTYTYAAIEPVTLEKDLLVNF